ncbi:MAG: hypothetical protein WCB67_04855 [Solirubrobacteraceae bacterium]
MAIRKACTPSQTKYAAPASLTATKAGSDATISAVIPTLAASVQHA